MYLTALFLPLISSLLSLNFGAKLGRKGCIYLTCICVLTSFFLSCFICYEVGLSGSLSIIEIGNWMNLSTSNVQWAFLFDSLTIVMLVVVTSVSSLVHIYSTSYMSDDPSLPRFMAYLSLFTFFMLMLVSANNLLQMFLGWEGVGLCSFLLINFWYSRIEANKAAMKAMIINKVGDFGFLVGILMVYVYLGSVNFPTLFAITNLLHENYIIVLGTPIHVLELISIYLFIGCVGKSAQIGLHSWLPDAMEGPTPVSALIHAATMVTAGVFMLLRCSPIFEYTSTFLVVVASIGAITSFLAGTIAIVQNDVKKVIAYSTCSQLGYMVFICGLSNYSLSLFHLMNHAFFKALLFLGAGALIHAIGDTQDMRHMGGLSQLLPMTYISIFIGSIALMGFPFLTGFYSKDPILEISFSKFTESGLFTHYIGSLTAALTAFYSFRLIYYVYYNRVNASKNVIKMGVHNPETPMLVALGVLLLGSIFVGYLGKDMFIGLGSDFIGNATYTSYKNSTIIDAEFLPSSIKLIPVLLSILSALCAVLFYRYYSNKILLTTLINKDIYTFLIKKYYYDHIYNNYIGLKSLNIGYQVTFQLIDKGLIELIGPYFLSTKLYNLSKRISLFQSGLVYIYMFVMIVTLIYIEFTFFQFYHSYISYFDNSIYHLLLLPFID